MNNLFNHNVVLHDNGGNDGVIVVAPHNNSAVQRTKHGMPHMRNHHAV